MRRLSLPRNVFFLLTTFFLMGAGRADEDGVYVVALDERAPVIRCLRDLELLRNRLRGLQPTVGDGFDLDAGDLEEVGQ